jgi:hypothetical protein
MMRLRLGIGCIELAVGVAAALSVPSAASAQEGDALREAAQNPIGNLISPPFVTLSRLNVMTHRQKILASNHVWRYP